MQFPSLTFLTASALVGADYHVRASDPSSQAWIRDFDNLVAFGDSYTDENRLAYFLANNGQAPPPGMLLPPSNVTNGGGVTWARWVSSHTGAKLYNYAVSGAVCDNNIICRWVDFMPFPDVVYEVDAFVADANYINETTHTNSLYTNRKSDNTVYSIWIGTNDLGTSAFLTDSGLHDTTIPDYVDCIYDKFDKIYKEGGRYFVLMNTAPLQLSPLYGMPGAGGLAASSYWLDKPANTTEVSAKMKEYIQLVNSLFEYRTPYELRVSERYPGASIAIFDVHGLITDIYNNPSDYLASPANVTGQYYKCDAATGETCTSQSDIGLDHFLWYDELHPSQTTDEVIAHEFAKVIKGSSKYATYW